MKKILWIGLFLLVSCGQHTYEKVTKVYSSGNPEIILLCEEGSDEIIYQKVMFDNQSIKIEGALEAGEKDGLWISYYDDGQIWTKNTYKSGVLEGSYEMFNRNGKPKLEGHYKAGKESGIWKVYDENGKFIEERLMD
ncbi:MAG: antitoxin component YwqK of YwqJK toxin-antitoxin module [Flavobacteriales bacterium]|jgi:antitoxin component YwqK of YwqJK toxin-antitoxin module